jgi:hypothetical protein
MNTNTHDTKFSYLSGTSGRVVCTRPENCAGVTLISAFRARPNDARWGGMNGESFVLLSEADAIEIASITGGSICDCGF